MAEPLNQVVRATHRAFTKNKALFIVVQYNHEAEKLSFINQLATELQHTAINISKFDPLNNDSHSITKLYPLLERNSHTDTLSLVVSLPVASGQVTEQLQTEFLNYLNLHRDLISQQKLKWLLFVKESQMAQFIEGASDLWSFKHKTIYLERALTTDENVIWQQVSNCQPKVTLTEEQKNEINQTTRRYQQLIAETQSNEAKANLFLDLGNWLNRHYAYEAATETALHALNLPELPIDLQADIEFQAAKSMYEQEQWSDAISHYKKALSLYNQSGNTKSQGNCHNQLGLIYKLNGEPERALSEYDKSLQIARDINVKKHEGVTLNNISQIYSARGDYNTALGYLKQSLKIRQHIGDKEGEGTTLNNISQIYKARGDYNTALGTLKQSLKIRQDIGDKKGEGTALNNISQIYHVQGDYNTALETLKQSLKIAQDIGDKKGEGVALNNISQIYDAQGDYNTALNYLNQSLKIRQEIGDKAGLCATLFNMGSIYLRYKRESEAFRCWLSVYEMAKTMDMAQALNALENLAPKLGMEDGLDGWERLYQEQQGMNDNTELG